MHCRPANTAALLLALRVGVACWRCVLLQGFSGGGLRLRRLDSEDIADSNRVEVEAEVMAQAGTGDTELEAITGRLSLEQAVTAARWRRIEERSDD